MTPEPTLWDEAQRLPQEACPNSVPKVIESSGIEVVCIGGKISVNGQGHVPDETCGGTGEVRSPLYEAIEMAETVPCPQSDGGEIGWVSTGYFNHDVKALLCTKCEAFLGARDRGGLPDAEPTQHNRVPREQPGVVACPCTCHGGPQRPQDVHETTLCPVCKSTTVGVLGGTVPDPSEAGVVARLEACGRLGPVLRALETLSDPVKGDIQRFLDRLQTYLDYGDYLGAHAAALEGVRALVAQGVA